MRGRGWGGGRLAERDRGIVRGGGDGQGARLRCALRLGAYLHGDTLPWRQGHRHRGNGVREDAVRDRDALDGDGVPTSRGDGERLRCNVASGTVEAECCCRNTDAAATVLTCPDGRRDEHRGKGEDELFFHCGLAPGMGDGMS